MLVCVVPLDETLGTASPPIGVISSYDPLTGLLENRTGGTGSPYTNRQDLGFEWDLNRNLTKRIDGTQSNLTEEFFYDALNRLGHSTRNEVQNLALTYWANGNIAECVFRPMPGHRSGACRAGIPVDAGPAFRSMPAGVM